MVKAIHPVNFWKLRQGPYQLGSARASEVLEELAPDEKKVELPSKIFVDRDFSLEIPPGFKTGVWLYFALSLCIWLLVDKKGNHYRSYC